MDRGPGGVGEGFAEGGAAETALAVAIELAEVFDFDDYVGHKGGPRDDGTTDDGLRT